MIAELCYVILKDTEKFRNYGLNQWAHSFSHINTWINKSSPESGEIIVLWGWYCSYLREDTDSFLDLLLLFLTAILSQTNEINLTRLLPSMSIFVTFSSNSSPLLEWCAFWMALMLIPGRTKIHGITYIFYLLNGETFN